MKPTRFYFLVELPETGLALALDRRRAQTLKTPRLRLADHSWRPAGVGSGTRARPPHDGRGLARRFIASAA